MSILTVVLLITLSAEWYFLEQIASSLSPFVTKLSTAPVKAELTMCDGDSCVCLNGNVFTAVVLAREPMDRGK